MLTKKPRLQPGLKVWSVLKIHRKHKRKTRRRASRRPLSQLTEHEIDLLRRLEIPLEQWRKGQALLGAKLERLTIAQYGPENGKAIPSILGGKAKLRRLIANDSQLVKDFKFLTHALERDPESLLQLLYFHCNMMGITLQRLIAREKKQSGPVDRKRVASILDAFSEERERRKSGMTPSPRRYSHDYLRGVLNELDFVSQLANRSWPQRKTELEYVFESMRQTSLYEQIRAKCGQYHSTRLHRLVNAARCAQDLQPIEQRAFIKWLNEFKKACERGKTASDVQNAMLNT